MDSVDSAGVGSSDSGLAVGFAVGCRLIAGGVAGLSAAVSAVSESVFSASLTVSAVGPSPACWAGGSSATVPSSPAWPHRSHRRPWGRPSRPSSASCSEGFGFAVPVLSLSESGLFSVEFRRLRRRRSLGVEPGGLSALATPAPATIPAATPAVNIPAPNHTKNSVAPCPSPVPTAQKITRVVRPRGRLTELTLADSSASPDGVGGCQFENPEEIGRGGFGVGVPLQPARARSDSLAVKVLTADVEPDNVERFVREQVAMGKLSGHPVQDRQMSTITVVPQECSVSLRPVGPTRRGARAGW